MSKDSIVPRLVGALAGIAGAVVALALVLPAQAHTVLAQGSVLAQNSVLAQGSVPAGRITTIAGGVGGPGQADQIAFFNPCALVSDGGVTYLTDESPALGGMIRRIIDSTDKLTTIMESNGVGSSPDGSSAAGSNRDVSCGVAIDHSGNVLFSERGGDATASRNRIRVVASTSGTFYGQQMKAAHVYTIAGTGTVGDAGDGGPATDAELNNPAGIAVDAAGNIVVADTGKRRHPRDRRGDRDVLRHLDDGGRHLYRGGRRDAGRLR